MSVDTESSSMSRLLKLAHTFNCFYLSGLNSGQCRPFIVEGFQVGLIRPDVMKQLLRYPEVFRVTSDYVELNPAFRDYEERTARVDHVLRELRGDHAFIALKGWRDEVSIDCTTLYSFLCFFTLLRNKMEASIIIVLVIYTHLNIINFAFKLKMFFFSS
ncbi:uncharacterized protein LOC116175931 [Photinus pyralis]|uniref:uncharacterized protein LOC116175931 n=1 Tax=Photinus pyralis TaxID=7054 RepID=UPI001267026F|nr:uncharacterized protein LOC116175931 [Photinus pyralis]